MSPMGLKLSMNSFLSWSKTHRQSGTPTSFPFQLHLLQLSLWFTSLWSLWCLSCGGHDYTKLLHFLAPLQQAHSSPSQWLNFLLHLLRSSLRLHLPTKLPLTDSLRTENRPPQVFPFHLHRFNFFPDNSETFANIILYVILGEGNGNPLQYSCPEKRMDREPGGLQSTGLQRVRHD